MRFRSSLQLVACLVAVTLIFGCGGAAKEKAATEKPAAEAPAEEASHKAASTGHSMGEPGEHVAGAAVCPVSGHDVDAAKAAIVTVEGREVQLCCQDCVETFNADPAKYMAILDTPVDPHAGHNH